MNTIQESRAFVLEQARLNIERVKAEPGYVPQAKQVNSSLASIVACERNSVMHDALQRLKAKDENLSLRES